MQQTVCITGTSRGIGLEFAKQYAKDGWQVYATCRNPETASQLQALSREYSNIIILPLDVTDEIAITKLAATLKGKPIDVLINNAGIYNGSQETLEKVSSEILMQTFKTNAVAPLLIARALMENIKLSQRKIIVNLSSALGSIQDTNSTGSYAYRTSKAALNMLMKTLAIDCQALQIQILVLHPGWVKTDMGGKSALIEASTSVEGLRKVIEKTMGKSLNPQDPMFINYKGDIIHW